MLGRQREYSEVESAISVEQSEESAHTWNSDGDSDLGRVARKAFWRNKHLRVWGTYSTADRAGFEFRHRSEPVFTVEMSTLPDRPEPPRIIFPDGDVVEVTDPSILRNIYEGLMHKNHKRDRNTYFMRALLARILSPWEEYPGECRVDDKLQGTPNYPSVGG